MNFMENKLFDTLISEALALGVFKAAVVDASKIETDAVFREMCASNACGRFGKCYMCPPDVGDIDSLIAEVRKYGHALVYQTVTTIEDSLDFEGMTEARRATIPISQALRGVFEKNEITRVLHLGAGGCGVCDRCAKESGEPCRAPSLAMPSLESHGINVSSLASLAGMKYINGQNTVTYFGAVLFSAEVDGNE